MKNILLLIFVLFVACNKSKSTEELSEIRESIGTSTSDPAPGTEVKPFTNPTWTEEFMELVNDHRRSLGQRAILHDEELEEIARLHSEHMAQGTVSFGHTGFSSRCSEGRDALGGGNWCGENVAFGQRSPQEVFTSWINSSGHRANIESERATHSGFSYARSSSGKYYWTHLFIEH
jgi:uncharacterized protein YkwD